CHDLKAGAVGVYSFEFGVKLSSQGPDNARYLSRGATFKPWQAGATTTVTSRGQLPVTGPADILPTLVLALSLLLAGAGLRAAKSRSLEAGASTCE
ncbi:MAG: hypothetical protein LBD90_01635, partial [Bifidobacteriaceae bacterium]|nr:hypothetical protein [Bifidobacteriaceae bacterium]